MKSTTRSRRSPRSLRVCSAGAMPTASRSTSAAALQGRSVTDFVLSSVQEAAQRAIDDYQRIDLSVKDAEAFVEALLNPKPVNDRLRETIRRYRRATDV